MPDVTLDPAGDELADVEEVLDRNGLPSGDVRAKPDCFFVARQDGDRIGVGGVEQYETEGLCRSVVVEESVRGDGLGTALLDRLEREAREAGVERLYLLTTTAADFFASRGYEEIEREETPPVIRQTAQFNSLCPASAVCLRKSL